MAIMNTRITPQHSFITLNHLFQKGCASAVSHIHRHTRSHITHIHLQIIPQASATMTLCTLGVQKCKNSKLQYSAQYGQTVQPCMLMLCFDVTQIISYLLWKVFSVQSETLSAIWSYSKNNCSFKQEQDRTGLLPAYHSSNFQKCIWICVHKVR